VHEALRLAVQRRALVGASSLLSRTVQLHGLSKAALNGRTGVCGALDPSKGRFSVDLDPSPAGGAGVPETISVRFNRLKLVSLLEPGKPAMVEGGGHAGKRGTLQSLDVRSGKWGLRLDSDGAEVEVAAGLLRVTAPACGQCGVEKAGMMRCSGCLRVYFCGRECQVAAWKGHKKACNLSKEGSVAVVDTTQKSGLEIQTGADGEDLHMSSINFQTMRASEGGKWKAPPKP
ncbi:hypothetical protein T484DRAFT_1787091, partial [Baffinella frigidus]